MVSCALLVATPWASGAAGDPGQAALVLAQAKVAAGGDAMDALQTLQLAQRVAIAGTSGTGQQYCDVLGGRYAQFAHLGPLSNGGGFDGRITWVQDPSGDAWPVGDYVETRSAQSSAYLTSLSFWYPARHGGRIEYRGHQSDRRGSYDVLRAYPDGGFPVDIWFDSQTHLIGREIIRVGYGRDSTIDFSDYRQVGDVVLPFTTRVAESGNVIDLSTTKIGINTKLDDHLVMPSTTPHDFSIAGGQTTTVPFELVNNHLYVKVSLDGKGPYRFILDTGGQNVMTPEVGAQLGSAVTGSLQVSGAGANTVSTGFAWVPSVSIGNATMRHQAFAVLPIGKILQAVEGEHIDGIVGVELLRRFVASIDYEHHEIILSTRAGAKLAGTAIPFVYDQSVPQIAGNADGLPGRFIIDTGNRTPLVLYTPFVQAHGLLDRYPSKVRGITGFGLGGPSTGQLVRVKTMQVAAIPVHDVVTTLSMDATGALTEPGTAGNIGGGILRRFTVGFDYREQLMYLARNSGFARPEPHDRSGLFLVQSKVGLRVIGSLSDTPAFAAGIRSGDVITAVNNRPVSAIGLLGVRSMLRGEPGTTIELTLQSSGSAKNVTFALRDYV